MTLPRLGQEVGVSLIAWLTPFGWVATIQCGRPDTCLVCINGIVVSSLSTLRLSLTTKVIINVVSNMAFLYLKRRIGDVRIDLKHPIDINSRITMLEISSKRIGLDMKFQ